MNWIARELAADDLRQRRHGQRLGQAGDALDQAVAVGEQAEHDPLDEPVLADDDALDLEERVLEQRGVLGAGTPALGEVGRNGLRDSAVGVWVEVLDTGVSWGGWDVWGVVGRLWGASGHPVIRPGRR